MHRYSLQHFDVLLKQLTFFRDSYIGLLNLAKYYVSLKLMLFDTQTIIVVSLYLLSSKIRSIRFASFLYSFGTSRLQVLLNRSVAFLRKPWSFKFSLKVIECSSYLKACASFGSQIWWAFSTYLATLQFIFLKVWYFVYITPAGET